MSWHQLELVGISRECVDLASAILFDLGAVGLQEAPLAGSPSSIRQPWEAPSKDPQPRRLKLVSWFEKCSPTSIEEALDPHLDPAVKKHWSTIEETDWEAHTRTQFQPIYITNDIVIAPPWNAPDGATLIEPGLGFGTGSHPSTQCALRLLETHKGGHQTLLDIGCGSGILCLVGMKFGMDTQGIDIDPGAIRGAQKNAELNGVSGNFTTTPISDLMGPADMVVANIHAELLIELAQELHRLTNNVLILAGILADRRQTVREIFDTLFEHVETLQSGEWVAYAYRRKA